MSQSGGDDMLIDLFREEVRANCQILTEGLVALEQGGASPKRLEEMMRAAHSIKGARAWSICRPPSTFPTPWKTVLSGHRSPNSN